VTLLYKITTTLDWAVAEQSGIFWGSALDLKDGFIHLSTAAQMRDTARLHFAGQNNLLLVAIPEDAVAADLKWEASRGGQLFPHVFSSLKTSAAQWVKALPWNGKAHEFPEGIDL
jgi:uncharacterized protein (DUF952 family)